MAAAVTALQDEGGMGLHRVGEAGMDLRQEATEVACEEEGLHHRDTKVRTTAEDHPQVRHIKARTNTAGNYPQAQQRLLATWRTRPCPAYRPIHMAHKEIPYQGQSRRLQCQRLTALLRRYRPLKWTLPRAALHIRPKDSINLA